MKTVVVTPDNLEEQFEANLKRLETDPKFAHDILVGHPEGNPVTLGPLVPSAEDWVSDMITGATNKGEKWLKKTLAPSVDPKDAALKAEGKWKNKTQEAINTGAFGKGVKAYDESAREAVIKEGGATAFTSGITRHRAKAVSKINKLQPKVAALKATIRAMPQDTEEQRKARLLAARELMIKVGKEMKGG